MTPAVPRPSASLLLLADDPFRVLMVRRPPHGSFPSARVFPGGVVEPGDRDPRWGGAAPARVAAIRETWEETGVLVGADRPVAAADFAAVAAAAPPPFAALVPFAHWITPASHARRWDTLFFACAMPAGQRPAADGREVVAIEWVEPGRADLAAADLPHPTRMNLRRLAASRDVAGALAAARAQPIVTADGG